MESDCVVREQCPREGALELGQNDKEVPGKS